MREGRYYCEGMLAGGGTSTYSAPNLVHSAETGSECRLFRAWQDDVDDTARGFVFFCSGRASEMFAYNDGKHHKYFGLTRRDVFFLW